MNFYVLEPCPKGKSESARTDVLQDERFQSGKAPLCPDCGGFIGSLVWLPPYKVEITTWGRGFGDFAFFGACGWFLVSNRFKELYQHSNLTGLEEFAPVDIIKYKRTRRPITNLPVYWKVNVAKSSAAVDYEASGFEWSVKPLICQSCQIPTNDTTLKRWKRLVISPKTWQGEDVFLARGSGQFMASRRFKDFCEANDVRNAVFILAEDYGHDYYPWEKTPANS